MMYEVKRSHSGLGLFATEDIKKGTRIIEYVGKALTDEEADEKGGKYLCQVDTNKNIDGTARSNTARYINHSCKPNAKMYSEKGRLFVYAIKRIKAGEEIGYDYGKEYVSCFIEPMGCRCAACQDKPVKKRPAGTVKKARSLG